MNSSATTNTTHHSHKKQIYDPEGAVVLNKGSIIHSSDPQDFPVPSHKQENWRFTPLRRLRNLHDWKGQDTVGAISYQLEEHPDNGTLFTVEDITREDPIIGITGHLADRVSATARTNFSQGKKIVIKKEQEVTQPIRITINADEVGVTFGHTVVNVEPFARATLIIRYSGSGTLADNIEFEIADSAHLTVIVLTEQDDQAVYVGAQYINLHANAHISHFLIQSGAEVARVSPFVRFQGSGANAQLDGLYLAGTGQYLEQRLLVDHSLPHCTSAVNYKGVLHGDENSKLPDAHTVWVGDVLIRAAAEATNTYEINRNLILSNGARADSVPNLEIETGEIIGAGHASTVSKFDDEQLFYLLSRGIKEKEAKKLVVRGFFGEIVSKIPVDDVREQLTDRIEKELAKVGV